MILESIYFFLPAYVANTSPAIFQHLKFLDKPLDFGLKYRGKRVFGDNKTIRGFVLAVILGTLTFFIQKQFSFGLFDYSTMPLMLGFWMSFGSILGDAVKSFFKRQLGIRSGGSWIPFDQLDFIVGGLLFSSIYHVLSIESILIIVVISVIGTMTFHYVGYLLGINKDKI